MGTKRKKKPTRAPVEAVQTNAGLARDGTQLTLKPVEGGYVVVTPEKWAGRRAALDAASGRWMLA